MIEFALDKKVNLLMLFYQISKDQTLFTNLSFEYNEKLTKEDRKFIRKMLRSKKINFDMIKSNEKINYFYEKNLEFWESYWDENLAKLEIIKNKLNQRLENFDFNKVEKLEQFFRMGSPGNIKIYVCMGNNYNAGTGNAFRPNLGILFPRRFNDFDEKSLDSDFAVMIHEVIHLYQDLSDENKEFIETIARCFAPKGILFGETVKEPKVVRAIPIIKKAFEEGKTLLNIREELIREF